MAKLMQVDVVDSEKQIFSGSVEHLIANASDGEIGIYPNHSPLICKLKPGILRLQLPEHDTQLIFAVSGGFMEVQSNHVIVLADIIERTDELDEARLLKQKDIALAKIKHTDATNKSADLAKAYASLDAAIASLKTLEYMRKHIRS